MAAKNSRSSDPMTTELDTLSFEYKQAAQNVEIFDEIVSSLCSLNSVYSFSIWNSMTHTLLQIKFCDVIGKKPHSNCEPCSTSQMCQKKRNDSAMALQVVQELGNIVKTFNKNFCAMENKFNALLEPPEDQPKHNGMARTSLEACGSINKRQQQYNVGYTSYCFLTAVIDWQPQICRIFDLRR